MLKTKNISFWETPNIFIRYGAVMKELSPEWSVLEVGAGSHGISEFFSGKLAVADINESDMRKASEEGLPAVVGDGCSLPFRSDSFDAVVSVASYEHVPASLKMNYLREMARVARRKVIIYCPFGKASRLGDRVVYGARGLFGIKDDQTIEHLKGGVVSAENFNEALPGCSIRRMQNIFAWLVTSLSINVPFLNKFLSGALYIVLLQWIDWLPPHYAAVISWVKK